MRIALIGATGAVGEELCGILAQREFPLDALSVFGSKRSAGQVRTLAGRERTIHEATPAALEDGFDVVFLSGGSAVARELAPVARDAGALVIDNSSAFRMDPACPLVIPEINGETLQDHRGIVANPNCSTILLCMALAPLHRASGLKRVVMCSYQAVSGAGARAMEEFRRQQRLGAGESEIFPKPIAENVIPWVQALEEDGFSTEETKVRDETRRILGLPGLPVTATCVRVPVPRAHSEAVHVELERPLSPTYARELLAGAEGVEVWPDEEFPTPFEVSGSDLVQIGRIRADRAFEPGLALWCVMDQLRKGAALNAVQIAERALGVGAGA